MVSDVAERVVVPFHCGDVIEAGHHDDVDTAGLHLGDRAEVPELARISPRIAQRLIVDRVVSVRARGHVVERTPDRRILHGTSPI